MRKIDKYLIDINGRLVYRYINLSINLLSSQMENRKYFYPVTQHSCYWRKQQLLIMEIFCKSLNDEYKMINVLASKTGKYIAHYHNLQSECNCSVTSLLNGLWGHYKFKWTDRLVSYPLFYSTLITM